MTRDMAYLESKDRQNTLRVWLAWLLVSSCLGQLTSATDSPATVTESVEATARSLLVEHTLHCNITSSCTPCLPKHLDSEACRPTAYTERLTCDAREDLPHQVTVKLRRRSAPRSFPLHVSRSCSPPGKQSSSAAGDQHITEQAMAESSSSDDSSTSSGEGFFTSQIGPTALYGMGGLNLLYFELVMVVILSGALPVVYIRKRRYVRL